MQPSTRVTLTRPSPSWLLTCIGRGPEEGRAYWTEQWSEIEAHVEPVAFYPEESGQILVDVHQVVRDLAGAVLADEHVGHRFSIQHGLIQAMEVCPLSSADLGA